MNVITKWVTKTMSPCSIWVPWNASKSYPRRNLDSSTFRAYPPTRLHAPKKEAPYRSELFRFLAKCPQKGPFGAPGHRDGPFARGRWDNSEAIPNRFVQVIVIVSVTLTKRKEHLKGTFKRNFERSFKKDQ